MIGTLDDFFFVYFHIQSNNLKQSILLIFTAELPELYMLTNYDIKAGKQTLEK